MIEVVVEKLGGGPMVALFGPFFFLLLCAFGFPMPEDIILVGAGILTYKFGHPLWLTMVVTYLGIIVGDSMIYGMGRRLGERAFKTRIGRRILSEKRQAKVESYFEKYGSWIMFFGRFMPGVRTAIYFTAGSIKISFIKFLLMDGLAALLSAPAFVYLGYWAWSKYHENFELIGEKISKAQNVLLIGILVALVITLFYLIKNRRREKILKASEVKDESH